MVIGAEDVPARLVFKAVAPVLMVPERTMVSPGCADERAEVSSDTVSTVKVAAESPDAKPRASNEAEKERLRDEREGGKPEPFIVV
jgi:hypothetical protein